MTAHPWALLLLLLAAQGALAQDDDAAAVDGATEECEECEEAWPYVEFLKIEMNEKVTEMLQDFKTSGGADETVSQTMEKIMEVREAILKRIKAIRKKDEAVVICPEQRTIKQEEKLSEFRMEVMTILLSLVESDAAENLKDIGDKLLKFRSTLSNEVMRVLMLPQPTCGANKKNLIPVGDCSECQILSELAFTLDNLQECAKKKDDEGAEASADDAAGDAAAGDDAADDDTAVPGTDCMAPVMYSMDLIVQNEKLDDAIAELYTNIIEEIDDNDKRTEYLEMLTVLKDYREKIDENIGALLDIGDDEEKIKKYVARNLRVLIGEVQTKLDECNAGCGGGDCKSCAKKILDEVIEKMGEYKDFLTAEGSDEDEKKDFIRGDMITLINKNNDDSRNIVKVKIDQGELEQCQTDELEVYNRIKGPMWMLVNLTIFGEITMVEEMLTASEEQLKDILSEYCTEIDKKERKVLDDDEDDNCEWDEYEKTKEYLVEVDNTIQNGLFKSNDDAAKMTALLGFVKIQEMFDKRVKKLFEDEATCDQELAKLKDKDNGYMTLLNKCMIQFMNPKVNFSELNRLQRISCIKKLRNEMEDRTAELLQFELTKSLNGITEDGATSR